jgi:hypothetical protein
MQYARNVNPNFERVLQSSLRPLIDELKKELNPTTPAWLEEVKRWLLFVKRQNDGLYRNKANKYKDALYHLVQTLNIAQHFSVGGTTATNACRFQRTNVPGNFDPGNSPPEARDITRMVVPSAWQNRTIEDTVARGLVDGIVVIHMSAFDGNAMNQAFDGWKTIDHMNSVLRVARRRVPAVPLALVEINNADVCAQFNEAAAYPGRQRCSVNRPNPDGVHSAQLSQDFRNWLAGKQNVVVMGYDGDICVRANLFGVQETIAPAHGVGPYFMRGNPAVPKRWVRPLVSAVNVETSRALLATGGNLTPVNHVGEYGPLHGL